MKVLHVINSLGAGGAERSLAEMLPGFRQRGVQNLVACLRSADDGVEDLVRSQQFEVVILAADSMWGWIRELRRVIRAERPDIVHTTIFEADIAGRLASFGLPCKVITSLVNTSYERGTACDPNVSRRGLFLARALDAWSARCFNNHFHAISLAVSVSAMGKLGLRASRISVIYRGRDSIRLGVGSPSRKHQARKMLDVPDDAPLLVSVGRQEFQKGHLDLLTAFAGIVANRPDCQLLLVGRKGHASPVIAARIRELGLDRHVRVLGHRSDVPDILAASDVFVFPSHYEGLGGAVIEAMALGLPVVATGLPAVLEVVEPNYNAIVVPPNDANRLMAAIELFLQDPAIAQQFGKRGREVFDEKFSLDRSVDEMLAMYRSVLSDVS